MDAIELKAQPRSTVAKRLNQVRGKDFVPAIVYGKDRESQPIQVKNRELVKVLKKAGRHTLISLQIEGSEPCLALARDVQRDVIRHHYLHVDFFAVRMDKKVKVKIPVKLVGNSPAVAVGGVMTAGISAVHIECLPEQLPEAIEVSLDQLDKFGDSVEVRDLVFPDGVKKLSDPTSMVVKVEPPRKVEAIEDAAGETVAAEAAVTEETEE